MKKKSRKNIRKRINNKNRAKIINNNRKIASKKKNNNIYRNNYNDYYYKNRENYYENQQKNKKTNKKKKKRKKIKIIVNWKAVFSLLFFILLIISLIYIYSKKDEITKCVNDYKTKIEVESKPDEYWTALNNVYTDDDILISVPVGTYFNSKQKNTCAIKIPRSAKLYAECRYSDMKDYAFKVADGSKGAAESIEDKLLTYKLAVRHMELLCEKSGTKMKYTVYSKDDGNYDTISTLNPNAVQVGTEKNPAVAYYSNNPIFDYDLYMYYYIDEETTLHISYSGPLSKILTAEELGKCIFNMIDEEYEILYEEPKKSNNSDQQDSNKETNDVNEHDESNTVESSEKSEDNENITKEDNEEDEE